MPQVTRPTGPALLPVRDLIEAAAALAEAPEDKDALRAMNDLAHADWAPEDLPMLAATITHAADLHDQAVAGDLAGVRQYLTPLDANLPAGRLIDRLACDVAGLADFIINGDLAAARRVA